LEKTFKKHRNKDGSYCRVRRFACPICEYKTTIYADGVLDLKHFPQNAVDEAIEHNELLS